MLRFLRLAFYAFVPYLFFRVGYPEAGHQAYHMIAVIGLLAASVGGAFALAFLGAQSLSIRAGAEIGFVIASFAASGLSMPAKTGRPPLQLLVQGQHPTRISVREGISLLGADANSQPARALIDLFPAK